MIDIFLLEILGGVSQVAALYTTFLLISLVKLFKTMSIMVKLKSFVFLYL